MTGDELDRRVERALREAAPQASGTAVLGQIAVKRVHLQRRRQARRGLVALAATTLVVAGVLVAVLDREPSPRITTASRPRVVEHATPRLDAGRALEAEPVVVVPDAGFLRPPVLPSGDTVAVAAYDRTETGFTFPPSRIVRVTTPGGHVTDRVELQGEIIALADGEGARWALTRDKAVKGSADQRFRVKRIAGDGTVTSNPVPAGEEPIGSIAAGGGGIWVPVRGGVLRFDLATGAFSAKVPLPFAEQRAIAVGGKGAYVSDGAALRRLDPTSDTASAAVGPPSATSILGLASSARSPIIELLAPDATGEATVADAFGDRTVRLPANVEARDLRSANGVLWVDATIDGAVVAIALDEALRAIERVVRLPDASDATLTFLSRERVLVVSGGQMWTALLGSVG
jgi:hypothetical protein